MPKIVISRHVKGLLFEFRFQAKSAKSAVFNIMSVSVKGVADAELGSRSGCGQVPGMNDNSRKIIVAAFAQDPFHSDCKRNRGLVAVREITGNVMQPGSAGDDSPPSGVAVNRELGSEMEVGNVHDRADGFVHRPVIVSLISRGDGSGLE